MRFDRSNPPPFEAQPAALQRAAMGPAAAAAVASCAFIAPLVMSIGANPAPTNPRTLLWYTLLRKPRFQPPDVAVPIAWAAVETGLAAGAYRLLRAPPSAARKRALALWGFNVAAIGAWSRVFFRHRDLSVSTAAAAVMVATGAAYVAEAREVDRPSAAAGVPFVAWVSFATVLTASLWALNRRSR